MASSQKKVYQKMKKDLIKTHAMIEEIEGKQKSDLVTALTGNMRDYLDYSKHLSSGAVVTRQHLDFEKQLGMDECQSCNGIKCIRPWICKEH